MKAFKNVMHKNALRIIIAGILCMIAFSILCASAETVNVSTVSDLQSAHPYSNSMDKTWVYTHSTAADSLTVTFSSDTATENNYDYIYIPVRAWKMHTPRTDLQPQLFRHSIRKRK